MRNPVEIGFKSVTDNRAPQYLDVDAPFPVREDWGMLTESSLQISPVLPLAFWSHTKLRMGRSKQFPKKENPEPVGLISLNNRISTISLLSSDADGVGQIVVVNIVAVVKVPTLQCSGQSSVILRALKRRWPGLPAFDLVKVINKTSLQFTWKPGRGSLPEWLWYSIFCPRSPQPRAQGWGWHQDWSLCRDGHQYKGAGLFLSHTR